MKLPFPFKPTFETPGHWWLKIVGAFRSFVHLPDPTPNYQYATEETAKALASHFGASVEFTDPTPLFYRGRQAQLKFLRGAKIRFQGGFEFANRPFTINAGMVAEPFVTSPEEEFGKTGGFRSLAEWQAWDLICRASRENPEEES